MTSTLNNQLPNGTARFKRCKQWKRSSCKQRARWQHLPRLKASAFFSLEQKNLVVKKHYNLYLKLVMPSGGWWSPIVWIPTFTLTQRHLVIKILIYIKMLFMFSIPVLIRHLWQLKTVVFLRRCLIRAVLSHETLLIESFLSSQNHYNASEWFWEDGMFINRI